ncbi:hypothetical protein LSAT2_027113 [Lamellibrachia satsuma]|nr:hypothetical protein LSAT2_027113 [Lamellibrachia satsuma]
MSEDSSARRTLAAAEMDERRLNGRPKLTWLALMKQNLEKHEIRWSSLIWAASSVSKAVQKKTSRHDWEKSGKHLRKILKVTWPETISNTKHHQATICLILKKRRWTWLGHVYRMSNDLPAKTALTWTPEGNRERGRPKTMWRRTMEEELKAAGLTWGTVARRAQYREVWRDLVRALCATRHEEENHVFFRKLRCFDGFQLMVWHC